MENRPDYIAFWAGMAKIAVRTALINSNLTGAGLAHCVKVADARALVMNAGLGPAFETARALLTLDAGVWHLGDPEGAPGSQSLEIALGDVSEERPDKSVRAGHKAGEVALYIYTSGTTGLPKAAKITNVRAQGLMAAFWKAVGVNEDDRVLLTLPLYHATGGMCGVGSALYAGATLILRRKFSASHFWQEAIDNRATMMVYIGELGRYLMNQPPSPQERSAPHRQGVRQWPARRCVERIRRAHRHPSSRRVLRIDRRQCLVLQRRWKDRCGRSHTADPEERPQGALRTLRHREGRAGARP